MGKDEGQPVDTYVNAFQSLGKAECKPIEAYVNTLHSIGIFMLMSKQSSGFATGWVVQKPFEGAPHIILNFTVRANKLQKVAGFMNALMVVNHH